MTEKVLIYLLKLLNEKNPPELDAELEQLSDLREIRDSIISMQDIIFDMWNEGNIVLEQKNLLQYYADHDPLTGSLNRRAFMRKALGCIENHWRHDVCCCIIIMDIDFFKKFNDSYGHAMGDKALTHLVGVIDSLMRSEDFLGRYGGEEFVVFLSNTDGESGAAIAERFRNALEQTPVPFDPDPLPMTASFGTASLNDMVSDDGEINERFVEKFIQLADKALYQAKRTGRNKIALYQNILSEELQENL